MRFTTPMKKAAKCLGFETCTSRWIKPLLRLTTGLILDLEHSFRDTAQGVRFAISQTARERVIDRLMELNHQRYAEEVAKGQHDKRAPKGKTRGTRAKGNGGDSSSPLLEGV